jgi:hypothetical protein
MANAVDQNVENTPNQPLEVQEAPPAKRRFAWLVRTALIASPLLLFGLAILIMLVFFVTLNPLLGSLTLGLIVAAGILAILSAVALFKY